MAWRILGIATSTAVGLISFPFISPSIARAATEQSEVKESTEMSPVAEQTLYLWDSNWDFREDLSSQLGHQRPVRRYLYLIRHGQFLRSGNKNLTDLGRQQAAGTGARLQSLNESIEFSSLVNSNLTRVVETADIIHGYLPHLKNRSCDPMLAEGTPCNADPIPPRPASSVIYVDSPRIEAAFRRYFYRPPATQLSDSHELIVCHANVIRYFVCRALQLPMEGWTRLIINHCSFTVIAIDQEGGVALEAFGDSYHLPVKQVTDRNVY